MIRWKVILAAVIIFAAGAVSGALIVRAYSPKTAQKPHAPPPFPGSPEHRNWYLERLDREVQLTAEQRSKVDQILTESQVRMKAVWEGVAPMAKEEFRRTRREISEVLTPEQREKMKKFRKDKSDDHRRQGDKHHKRTGEKMESSSKDSPPQCSVPSIRQADRFPFDLLLLPCPAG